MQPNRLGELARSFRSRFLALAVLALVAVGAAQGAPQLGHIALATSDGPGVVHRSLPADMLEAYAEGEVVALGYVTS